MKKILLATIIPLSVLSLHCALANTAKAQPEPATPWNQHTGFYAEFNTGPNFYVGVLATDDGTFSSSGFHGLGWNANLGYYFTHNFALEAGFMQNYGTFNVNDDDNVSAHTNLPYLTTRFTVPMGDKWAFIAKAGLMYAWVTEDDNNENTGKIVLPFTGLGFSYAITPKLEASVQAQGALYGVINLGLLSAGLTYHF